MANNHKKFSTLFLRKMRITIIIKYTTPSVERIKLKTLKTLRVSKNGEQPESSFFDDDCVNQYNHFGKGDGFLMKSNIHQQYDPEFLLLCIDPREMKAISTKRHCQEGSYQLYSILPNIESPQMSISSKTGNQILICSQFAVVLNN